LAGIVFLAGIVTMPLQARLLAPGIVGNDRASLVAAGVLCWGMFFLSILSLPMRASMSIENRVWPGASAAFIRSAGFVLALGVLVAIGSQRVAETAAWAALAAGLGLLIVHLLALGAAGWTKLNKALRAGASKNSYKPLMTGLLLVFGMQLLLSGGRLLDRVVASTMAVGTLAAIEYSYAFLMAIAAVIGTSANIFLAPRIGRAFKQTGHLPIRYWKFLIGITGVAALAGVALAFLVVPTIRFVLEYGAFSHDDTVLTARVLRLHALSLGPLVLALVLMQVVILTGGQRWLVPITAVKLAVKAAALWLLLRIGLGLEGIALSLGVAETVFAIILAIALWRRYSNNP
jgi:peptidoglycan biosynthesis protein MviN/MurJ (putative lipid II flippase)